ncbi:MAG: translesion error-prone DNA polymerase V autoproteolytic subunit [Bacteroidaceae bacterium]|nr:translesion error-prone DNA polymerase V autoproteolytic subunit [Bacteroidaceae bacterium]
MKIQKKPQLEFYPIATDTRPTVPMAEVNVHAGFPCPVDDAYMSQPIDLNKELIRNPASSYIVRVAGDSMIDEGIAEGDLLVVDRSILPTEQNVTVCMVDGEFALKRIVQRDGKVLLMPGNAKYAPIEVANPSELRIFGVVVWVMKRKL